MADFKAAGDDGAQAIKGPISVFKVFSATKARDREDIGERVSAWIASNPDIEIKKTVVCLSSDSQFHCLSFVLIGTERPVSAR